MGSVDQAVPRHAQVAEAIHERIRNGDLAPGDAVPSEQGLRDEFGIGKSTANRASALLRAWGLIETRVGSGTVVAEPRATPSSPSDHTDRAVRGEPIYAPSERSVIYQAAVIVTDVVSPAVLQAADYSLPTRGFVDEGSTIVKRARVLYRDDEPFGACTTWLNHPLIKQQGPRADEVLRRLTSTSDEDKFRGGTAQAVADLFGKDLTHTTTRVDVVAAPTEIARELKITPGTRMLWMLVTRFADDWVVEVDEWFRLPGAGVIFA